MLHLVPVPCRSPFACGANHHPLNGCRPSCPLTNLQNSPCVTSPRTTTSTHPVRIPVPISAAPRQMAAASSPVRWDLMNATLSFPKAVHCAAGEAERTRPVPPLVTAFSRSMFGTDATLQPRLGTIDKCPIYCPCLETRVWTIISALAVYRGDVASGHLLIGMRDHHLPFHV
ncbi:hypothetical protein TOPH_00215 [Tolypocladium ophioglossoides CBS 100239]|uniref:Uncharacterized protein n=1 Tax=Tolypocladium ophioglossoides (strain CBS 100239) TaxID=1163406 RepID=A0A0L0NMS4_TOLOC|nr:hypothetical protein TOPH_00215 [Tolypocladium ophioglossoides CBS 100239]